MNAPSRPPPASGAVLTSAALTGLAAANAERAGHIAQDLRAELLRVPEDLRGLLRSAAIVCDAYAALRSAVGEMLDSDVQPPPIAPPFCADEPCS